MTEMEDWFKSVKTEAASERSMREMANARLQVVQVEGVWVGGRDGRKREAEDCGGSVDEEGEIERGRGREVRPWRRKI